jgi:GntR family transcriptional regulator
MAPSVLADSPGDALQFGIDRSSAQPYYEQIYRLLLDDIMSGALAPGEKLLQEREYASRLGVSLAPVRQAMLALAKDGYLTRTRGRGTFVREGKVANRIQLLSSFTAALGATGEPVAMSVLVAEAVPPSSAPPATSPVAAPGELFHIRRLAYLSDDPVALLSAYLPTRLCEGLTATELRSSLYGLLERRHGTVMTSARNTIDVVRARPEEAGHLQVPVGEALLRVESITRDQHGASVEFSTVLYRADRFRFEIDSRREAGDVAAQNPSREASWK